MAFRTLAGMSVINIRMIATKRLPLTTIANIVNLTPLVTVVLAFLFFKEKVKKFQWVMLILCGTCVMSFSYFKKETAQVEEQEGTVPIWVFYVLVSSTPLLLAGVTIAMKNMQKFHNIVVSWYLGWSTVLICWTVSFLTNENQQVFKHFSWTSWALLAGISISDICSRTMIF